VAHILNISTSQKGFQKWGYGDKMQLLLNRVLQLVQKRLQIQCIDSGRFSQRAKASQRTTDTTGFVLDENMAGIWECLENSFYCGRLVRHRIHTPKIHSNNIFFFALGQITPPGKAPAEWKEEKRLIRKQQDRISHLNRRTLHYSLIFIPNHPQCEQGCEA
jgi:hypothetical protein